MSKIQLRFISFIVNLPPPKITANSTPITKQNGDTHTEYLENQTLLLLAIFWSYLWHFLKSQFFYSRKTKAAKLQRKVYTQFIHYYYYYFNKTSHLTPGLGLCNILGKRQIRQFLGVKIQLYMPKSHLRVDIVFQNSIDNKGEWSRCKPHDDSWLKWP